MIERKKQELYTAMQIYKSYHTVTFRIYASTRPLPKVLAPVHDIYELMIDLSPPYGCWLNKQFVHYFTNFKVAYSILLERVRTLSTQFGFNVPYDKLRVWHGKYYDYPFSMEA